MRVHSNLFGHQICKHNALKINIIIDTFRLTQFEQELLYWRCKCANSLINQTNSTCYIKYFLVLLGSSLGSS